MDDKERLRRLNRWQVRDSLYTPRSFRLVDLHDLLCDVKYEFNSDNRRLYAAGLLLLKGAV